MNLCRCLARSLLSASSPTKRLLLRSASALSTVASPHKRRSKGSISPPEEEDDLGWRPPKKDPPRPIEIPYQSRVANSVHLVGTVGVPVQLQAAPDGSYSAVSVLVLQKTTHFPHFWIPVIFQGDLAQIAACHLKENDLVYVTGWLSGDAPSLTIQDAQTSLQVLAQSLNFVEKGSPIEEESVVHEDAVASNFSGNTEGTPIQHLWDDLLANPHSWWDNRSSKKNPAYADFKHKDSGQLLWVNESTPEGVRAKLDLLFGQEIPNENLWSDLIANPKQWRDCRMDKTKKLVNPKYPDFKHKDTQKGLWADSAPEWVLPKLDELEFTGGGGTSEQVSVIGNSDEVRGKFASALLSKKLEKEKLWKSLVENPDKWWDNRSRKLKSNHPDFKHKDTGEALWVSSDTPSWVLPHLEQLKDKPKI